jgi:hypothetical protein
MSDEKAAAVDGGATTTTTTTTATDDSQQQLSASLAGMKLSGGGRHIAGSSMQFHDTSDSTSDTPTPSSSFGPCQADSYHLRVGPNYSWYKSKAPSPPALYDLAGVDLLKCGARIDQIGEKVDFPEAWQQQQTEGNNKNLPIPPILVINFQLPSDFSTSWFTETTDGDGWSMVFYFKVTAETLAAAQSDDDMAAASPALRLFANYCKMAPEAQAQSAWSGAANPWVGRFKAAVRCDNIEQFGLPSFITAYNAKPVLIRNTGTLFRGKDNAFLEMDINVHRFASVPKKALEVMFNKFDDMILAVAFCIESRGDEEMPETVFGCGTINKPTHRLAPQWVEGK